MEPPPILGIYIALGLFAALGAIIATGFGSAEAKAALVAGIAAPAIVTNVLAGAEERAKPPIEAPTEDTASFGSFFVSAAFAQTVEAPPAEEVPGADLTVDATSGSLLTLVPRVNGGLPNDHSIEFSFTFDGFTGAVLPTTSGSHILNLSAEQGVIVPEGATGITIAGISTPLDGQGGSLDVTVDTRPTIGGDLLWALGGQRRFTIDSIEVAPAQ